MERHHRAENLFFGFCFWPKKSCAGADSIGRMFNWRFDVVLAGFVVVFVVGLLPGGV